mmetsp:Transcript_12326/g.18927  ORF Transcript_12326/g.18927 Transcript_12326/m.18927 type:complete len:114 (+) Transcript_12326:104-445(+)
MADVTKEQFEEIAAIVGDSTVTPERQATYGEKCQLYGLYKRATLGKLLEPFDDDDIETESRPERPGMLQVQQRAKYDAWKTCQDMTKQEAMDAYATLAMDTVGKKVKDVLAKN